jgi:hypothetical protein
MEATVTDVPMSRPCCGFGAKKRKEHETEIPFIISLKFKSLIYRFTLR